MGKTKVNGFICVTSKFDETEVYISIDSIETFEDSKVSTMSDDYDVMETAEQIAQLINESRE
jgi:hypothetical protein